MENPIKMDDLGVPLFLETPMYQKNAIQNSTTLRYFLSLDLQIQIDNRFPLEFPLCNRGDFCGALFSQG